jgi:hypothetical protein
MTSECATVAALPCPAAPETSFRVKFVQELPGRSGYRAVGCLLLLAGLPFFRESRQNQEKMQLEDA